MRSSKEIPLQADKMYRKIILRLNKFTSYFKCLIQILNFSLGESVVSSVQPLKLKKVRGFFRRQFWREAADK